MKFRFFPCVMFFFCSAIGIFCCAESALAQSYYVPPSYLQVCSAAPGWMVTTRIVQCVEYYTYITATSFLQWLTTYYRDTIIAIFVFSLVLFSIKVMAGIEDITKEALIYFIKLGLVVAFAFGLYSIVDIFYALLHYIPSFAVGQWSPWASFDAYLGKLFGFGNANQLFNGLIGMAFAAAFSGITGILVAVIAILSMITTVYFSFRAMLTYLAAVVLVSFLAILAPLVVPLALFSRTTRYVEKWLDYLIACVINTLILFAFLYLFVGVINTMLDWFIYGLFGGNDFTPYYRANRNIFSWMMTADPTTVKLLENTLGDQTNRTALQTFASPVMSQAVDLNPMRAFALDFGPNQVWGLQLMVFGFLGLFIVSYLMLSMLNYLPEVADSIAGIFTGLRVEGIPFISEFRHALMKLKAAVSSS